MASEDKPKRKKVPRPAKPPFKVFRESQSVLPSVGLIHEKLIGRVALEWSKLEAALDDSIWRMVGLPIEDGRVLTARMDAKTKCDVLRALAPRHLDAERLATILTALDNADILRDDRNFILHGGWGTLLPEAVPIAASLRAKSTPGEISSETFPKDRMNNIILRLIGVRTALVKLMDELETSPDKSS